MKENEDYDENDMYLSPDEDCQPKQKPFSIDDKGNHNEKNNNNEENKEKQNEEEAGGEEDTEEEQEEDINEDQDIDQELDPNQDNQNNEDNPEEEKEEDEQQDPEHQPEPKPPIIEYIKVNFTQRNDTNNTHCNVVDDHIEEITSWAINPAKYQKILIFYYLSLGILYLIVKLKPVYIIKFYCEPSTVEKANYLKITVHEKVDYLVEIKHESFRLINPSLRSLGCTSVEKLSKDNIFLSRMRETDQWPEDSNEPEKKSITFIFKTIRYTYINEEEGFKAIQFSLETWPNRIIGEKFINNCDIQPSTAEHNYLLNKYGTNELHTPMFIYFWKHLLNWENIFCLFCFIIWIIEKYYVNAAVTLIAYIIMISLFSYFSYQDQMKNREILSTNLNNKTEKTVSENRKIPIDERIKNRLQESWAIVPGTFKTIELSSSSDFTLECDGLIIKGYCTVDESELTGESSEIYKMEMDPRKDGNFSYSQTNSLLFRGTKIKKIAEHPQIGKKVIILVLNTGMNTQRGNLLLNLLFPRVTNFSQYINIKIFVCIMALVCIGTGITLAVKRVKDNMIFWDSLTVVLPPMLFLSLNASLYYYKYLLQVEGISCSDAKKIQAAAAVNVVIFDKTGTLTKDEFELSGFQFAIPANNNGIKTIVLSEMEKSAKVMNQIHQSFWRNFDIIKHKDKDYEYNQRYSLVYFTECLGCCHGIDKFDDKYLGDSIDLKIFENINWTIQMTKDDQESNRYLYPSHLYRITEQKLFKQLQINILNKTNEKLKNQYKLKVIKHFAFRSETQSDSVLVQNCLDGTYRLFAKGAPEKILEQSKKDSQPENVDEAITKHTITGSRIIACATRTLTPEEITDLPKFIKEYALDKQKKENTPFTFLGFVIFTNPLKEDTKSVIQKLFNAEFKLSMSTGDNEETSIRVAQESGMISMKQENTPHYTIDCLIMDDIENEKERKLIIM